MNDKVDVVANRLPDGTLVLPLTTVTAILRQIADNVEVWQQSGRTSDPVAEIRAVAEQIDAAGLIDQVSPDQPSPGE
ncbi:hypothetical protein [Streptomyces boncukensis]|uniref:Uncharacterized protein n=1 Tax=Streptomyces boncukensis TaxID=2711219 RepID=A0A6G4WP11_9ACTN|nr:hypothetical protein [Streptomyces boncukensis]NGO66999.1 hypothetical protein [Streptomyces boncukensis]